ncbi:hypothetical protein CBL_13976 [Carabus blaptoides fortunei]
MKAPQARKISVTGGESATVLRRKKRERSCSAVECWPVKGLTARELNSCVSSNALNISRWQQTFDTDETVPSKGDARSPMIRSAASQLRRYHKLCVRPSLTRVTVDDQFSPLPLIHPSTLSLAAIEVDNLDKSSIVSCFW